MIRGATAVIDLDALVHNFQRVRQLAPQSRIMPVIKADAYGHGMVPVARALAQAHTQADGFAVAHINEAQALREAGITQPITVFQGFQDVDQLQRMIQWQLWPTIHQSWQLDILEQQATSILGATTLGVWLKVNTGMGRLGLPPGQVAEAWGRLQQCVGVQPLGLMSHFANADQPPHPSNGLQIEQFQQLKQQLRAQTSLCNSAGLIAFPEQQGDWVRPGIMLYGASPFVEPQAKQQTARDLGLRPVMRFEAPLVAINHLKKGDAVGYGHRWVCPQDMPVGVVAAGYGDGYPRLTETGAPVSVHGDRSQLLGRVSMDSLSIDLRQVDTAQCGDSVVLWGGDVPVDEVAASAQTIAYELLCNAGKCRFPASEFA